MYVEVNNARLWVEDDGDGPAILFLHGGLGDARLWEPVAERLRDSFRCLRYDIRFFGRSEGPDEEWSAVADSIGVLDALGVARAAVVGLSMGGGIALRIAQTHPDRVTAVVHVAGAVGPFELEGYDPGDTREAEMRADFAVWAPLGVEEEYEELWFATPEAHRPSGVSSSTSRRSPPRSTSSPHGTTPRFSGRWPKRFRRFAASTSTAITT